MNVSDHFNRWRMTTYSVVALVSISGVLVWLSLAQIFENTQKNSANTLVATLQITHESLTNLGFAMLTVKSEVMT
jgi:hypothetical protein